MVLVFTTPYSFIFGWWICVLCAEVPGNLRRASSELVLFSLARRSNFKLGPNFGILLYLGVWPGRRVCWTIKLQNLRRCCCCCHIRTKIPIRLVVAGLGLRSAWREPSSTQTRMEVLELNLPEKDCILRRCNVRQEFIMNSDTEKERIKRFPDLAFCSSRFLRERNQWGWILPRRKRFYIINPVLRGGNLLKTFFIKRMHNTWRLRLMRSVVDKVKEVFRKFKGRHHMVEQ